MRDVSNMTMAEMLPILEADGPVQCGQMVLTTQGSLVRLVLADTNEMLVPLMELAATDPNALVTPTLMTLWTKQASA
jgi:hypothetical protein